MDGTSQGAITSYTFTNVTATHTIAATFAINTYALTATAGSGGTITPGTTTVNYGSNQTFTITPNTGYHVASVTVDGTSQGAITSYTFTNVTATHTIAATFAINTFTITATAGANGSISPSGAVVVNSGSNQTFTITPNTGYSVANVTVDSVSQGAITTYTFTNVTATHTIAATFAINTFTITATAGANGSISPSGAVVVNSGSNQTFTITPNTGYSVANVTVDSVSQGAITTYTFTNVTATHTIAATFAINTNTISTTAGSCGNISPSGAVVVSNGGNQTFTITPNTGYHVVDVTVDSVSQGAITSYTFTNVTANHTIAATFAINTSSPSANYFYDDLSRLTRVVQGTTGVIYNYDELGNLVSIASATTAGGPPTLTGINPNVLFVGSKMLVTIAGQNLLTTQSVTSSSGLVTINNVTATDTQITAEMTALSAGNETIVVTTLNGGPNTATSSVTISSSNLTFIPGQLSLALGTSGTLTASISPPINTPLTIYINNNAPSIVTVPSSITIPASGIASFTVNALQLGIATLNAGDPRSVVFVASPFSGDVNSLSSSKVSVLIDALAGTTPIMANSVSIAVDGPYGTTTGTAAPVSAIIDAPLGNSQSVSGGVSVKIQ